MVVISVTIFAILLTPVFVVRQQHQETERVITQLESNAERRLEEAIKVNVLTITCILTYPPETRTRANMTACIREGFADSSISPPPAPDDPIDP